MARKKISALEWRKAKKRARLISILIWIGVGLVVLGVFGYIAWDTASRSWVMEINGERLSARDFQYFYMFGQSFDAIFEQAAFYMAVKQMSNESGVALSSEEENEIRERLADTRALFEMVEIPLNRVSDSRLIELMSTDVLFTRLTEIYTSADDVDEQTIESEYMLFLFTRQHEYLEITYRLFVTDADFEIQELREELIRAIENGEDPEDVLNAAIASSGGFDSTEDFLESDVFENTFITIQDLVQEEGLEEAWLANLANLNVGEVSEIFEIGGEGWYQMFLPIEIIEPDFDELRANFWESYIQNERNRRMFEILGERLAESNVVFNERF